MELFKYRYLSVRVGADTAKKCKDNAYFVKILLNFTYFKLQEPSLKFESIRWWPLKLCSWRLNQRREKPMLAKGLLTSLWALI